MNSYHLGYVLYRYIICKWKRENTQDVESYLFDVNHRLEQLSRSGCKTDVIQIVPLELMTGHQEFYNYLLESNNTLGMRQVINLAKIAAFCKDVTLREDRQSELKKQSLDFWKIPELARTAPPRLLLVFTKYVYSICLSKQNLLGNFRTSPLDLSLIHI